MPGTSNTRRPLLLVFLLATGALGLTLPASLAAQQDSDGYGPAVLSLPTSVRALGSGNALQLAGRGPDAIFYNSALAGASRGITGGYQQFGDDASFLTFSGATDWWGGGVAIGVRALGYGRVEAEDGFRAGSEVPGEREVLAGGDASASELAASLAYGRSLFGIRMGIGASLVEQRLSGESDRTVAFDVGASQDLGPVTAWLSVQNLGPALDMPDIQGVESDLPYRVTLGASSPFRMPIGPLDLGTGAAVVRLADGTVALNAGVEIAWWPVTGRTFLLRVGHHGESSGSRPLTLGAGFIGDRISIDYAHQSFGGSRRAHRFGIGWR